MTLTLFPVCFRVGSELSVVRSIHEDFMTSVPASVEPSLARAQSIQEAMLEDAIEDNTPAPVTETPGSEHEDNVKQRLLYVASTLSILVLLKCYRSLRDERHILQYSYSTHILTIHSWTWQRT